MARSPVADRLAPHVARLGKVPDQLIADLAGVSRATVVNFRNRGGVLPYERFPAGGSGSPAVRRPAPGGAEGAPFKGRQSKLDAFLPLLGVQPDADIAALAGVTAENVRAYRTRRNLPPAPRAGTGPEARAGRTVFSVVVGHAGGERTYAVVAHDIAEAATRAVAHVGRRGAVRAVAHLADLLLPGTGT